MLPEDIARLKAIGLVGSGKLIEPIWYEDFIEDKSKYYKSFYIPKTAMRKKIISGYKPPYPRDRIPESELHLWRRIAAPVNCLRDFQKQIMYMLYSKKPSKFEFCVSGKDRFGAIRNLAGHDVIIAADIKDAFPSTKNYMVRSALRREGFSPTEIEIISEIGTLHYCLPQGSPCSPALLNICRKQLDYRLEGYIRKRYNGVMSVYVDNYYFASNDHHINKCIKTLKKIAGQCNYEFPDKKIYVMRKGGRQGGLGLVASSIEGNTIVQPDKKYRKKLEAILHNGMDRKSTGNKPWKNLTSPQVRGMIECFRGSIYYRRFRDAIDAIDGTLKMHADKHSHDSQQVNQ